MENFINIEPHIAVAPPQLCSYIAKARCSGVGMGEGRGEAHREACTGCCLSSYNRASRKLKLVNPEVTKKSTSTVPIAKNTSANSQNHANAGTLSRQRAWSRPPQAAMSRGGQLFVAPWTTTRHLSTPTALGPGCRRTPRVVESC